MKKNDRGGRYGASQNSDPSRYAEIRGAWRGCADARPASAQADAAAGEAEIKKLYAGKKPGEGKIKLDVPQIAENGLVVPINVEIESPMTSADFVKAVHVWADANPSPGILRYAFSPECGKASAWARMRLAQTQDMIFVAEMSNGALFTTKAEVKVTIGGCGG